MKPLLRLALATLLAGTASAHEGPEHEIEELTQRMVEHGETAGLLAERAVEYRVLGKLAEATKDLERAVTIDPASLFVHRELARVLFLDGKADAAIAEVAQALTLDTEEPADTAALRMLRAEIYRSKNEPKKAIEDCDAALKLHRRNPEWYMFRSDIHRRLKLPQERLAGIEEGIAQTGAGVLGIERVEVMIDAGQSAAALKIIETELADSRLKGSWLIRRARAFQALGKKTEAQADLADALEEIARRLNSKTPDVPLVLDKALALELRGEKRDAIRTYEQARDQGAGDFVNDKIKSLQEQIPPAEK